MKVLRVAALALTLAIPLSAWAADGNKLLEQCNDAVRSMDKEGGGSDLNIGYCIGVVRGVYNTLAVLNALLAPKVRLCAPEGGITNGQGARIVLQYLRENPSQLHEDDVFLTMMAFKKAYPCK